MLTPSVAAVKVAVGGPSGGSAIAVRDQTRLRHPAHVSHARAKASIVIPCNIR